MPIEDTTTHTNIPTLTSEGLGYYSIREGGGFERSSAAQKMVITSCQLTLTLQLGVQTIGWQAQACVLSASGKWQALTEKEVATCSHYVVKVPTSERAFPSLAQRPLVEVAVH